jgi:phage shock protein E
MKKLVASLLISVITLTSCGAGGGVVNQNSSEFAKTIGEKNVVILDVRTPAEFGSGHILGAMNIDIENKDFDSKMGNLDRRLTYAVYCRSGRRSVTATEKMSLAGFTHLYNLTEGILEWVSSGHQIVI